MTAIIDNLGGELQDIYINELAEHTYFAKLRIRKDGELVEIDCRPSDAIAVAVTANVPIFVAEAVLNRGVRRKLTRCIDPGNIAIPWASGHGCSARLSRRAAEGRQESRPPRRSVR